MTQDKPGGAAFPRDSYTDKEAGLIVQQNGMSLRDWFAGQALAGFGANPETYSWDYSVMARAAYAQADAMLAAREAME